MNFECGMCGVNLFDYQNLECTRCSEACKENNKYYCTSIRCAKDLKFGNRNYKIRDDLFKDAKFAMCDKCNEEINKMEEEERTEELCQIFIRNIKSKKIAFEKK
jgi:hypothetical protein